MASTSTQIPALTFDVLAQRLVRDLANLIHSGASTERRMAAMVGLSQSHLHNVLSGARKLTPSSADQVMKCLDWPLLNLVETAEALALIGRRQASVEYGREVALDAQSGVGPDLRMRDFRGDGCVPVKGTPAPGCEITVPNRWLARTGNPVAVEAGDDPEMDGIIENGDILLLDCCRTIRATLHEDALYVVRWGADSLARWVRYSSRGLYLVSARNWQEPSRWTLAVIESSRRAELIEGKIIALAQPQDGTFRRPAQPFASS